MDEPRDELRPARSTVLVADAVADAVAGVDRDGGAPGVSRSSQPAASLAGVPEGDGSTAIPTSDVDDAYVVDYDVDLGAQATETLVDLTADPRFAARITEIELDRARRRSYVLLGALVVLAVVAVGSIVMRAAVFDVDHVEVQGANRETVDTILDAAAIRDGVAIWSVDVGAVESRVERLPWIADARVSRSWPDSIVISVREYTATAFVRAPDGRVALFGPDGRVLEYEPSAPPGTVEIVGARRVPEVGEIFFPPGVGALMVEIPDELAARVSTIDVADGVTLRLVPAGRVRLCDATDLARKGSVALALLEQRPDAAVVDVCVPTAPTTR